MRQDDSLPQTLQTRRITDFSVIEALYRNRLKRDFARNERKPLAAIRRMWDGDAYDCYGLFSAEALLGYAFFVRIGRNYLFDYLAIEAGRRDEGLGSVFLRQLAACLTEADCVVGEVEDPDKAETPEERALRERRLAFYVRAGYRRTALASRVFGADYRILEVPVGRDHSAEELLAVYAGLYQSILPAPFLKTQFRVRIE
jgi:hypothetical protein